MLLRIKPFSSYLCNHSFRYSNFKNYILFLVNYFCICVHQVLFPNDSIEMILARMIGMFGPIDLEMLEQGQETDKYFTKEYDLYHINEVCFPCFLPQYVKVYYVLYLNKII